MNYLVIGVKNLVTKWIDPKTSKEMNSVKCLELEWKGIEEISDFLTTDDGHSWYDSSTTVSMEDENVAISNIMYHIAIPSDDAEIGEDDDNQSQTERISILQNLTDASMELEAARTVDEIRKALNRCYRACSIYIYSNIVSYLVACGATPTEEGIYTAGLKPSESAKNQLCVTSDGVVHMKSTLLVDGQPKEFKMTLPFPWFLYHTLVTNELADTARTGMGLPELQLPEEDESTEISDDYIDQNEMEWIGEKDLVKRFDTGDKIFKDALQIEPHETPEEDSNEIKETE